MKIVFGLGNIGEEYKNTRHNAGAIVASFVREKIVKDSELKVKFLEVDNFMNNSGKIVLKYVKPLEKETIEEKKKNKEKGKIKEIKDLVVIYDDMDLPLGKIKISFNRSSGGHNGLNSIIKTLKTQAFTRIRIGVSPMTPKGIAKKPAGEEKILKFLLGDFKKEELVELKKISKTVALAVETIFNKGREKAMTLYN
ncbi:MAG: aminoacyl-tRNA hydrolase [bacterium]|nr:aminoacyl-tRNA hydrolase [bacterium]